VPCQDVPDRVNSDRGGFYVEGMSASPDTDSESDRTTRLIQSGADLAGASVGAAVGLVGGAPGAFGGAAAGVAATRALRHLGSEVEQRWLAPRQRIRVGAAFAVAAESIALRLEAGETPRSDGFFDSRAGERSPAEELLEGVLVAAADSYEERKVPYLGRLFASLVFDSAVSRGFANFMIRTAERLTFQQLVIMAVVWEGDATPAAEEARTEGPPKRVLFSDEVGMEVDELERLGLVGRGEPGGSPKRGGMTFVDASGMPPSNLTLPGPGMKLYDLMGLSDIPQETRRALVSGLWRRSAKEQPRR
jgi:hypothetical protein